MVCPLGTLKTWWAYFTSKSTKPFSLDSSRKVPRTFFCLFLLGLADGFSMLDYISRPEQNKGPESCLVYLQDVACQQDTSERWSFCFPLCRLWNTTPSRHRSSKMVWVFHCDLPPQCIYTKEHKEADPLNNKTTSFKDLSIHKTKTNYYTAKITELGKSAHVWWFVVFFSWTGLKLFVDALKSSK